MFPSSTSEAIAILVAALVLYVTGFFQAAGAATWKAIQDKIAKRKDVSR